MNWDGSGVGEVVSHSDLVSELAYCDYYLVIVKMCYHMIRIRIKKFSFSDSDLNELECS